MHKVVCFDQSFRTLILIDKEWVVATLVIIHVGYAIAISVIGDADAVELCFFYNISHTCECDANLIEVDRFIIFVHRSPKNLRLFVHSANHVHIKNIPVGLL